MQRAKNGRGVADLVFEPMDCAALTVDEWKGGGASRGRQSVFERPMIAGPSGEL